MFYSNLGSENSDTGHIKCSRGPHLARGPQVLHPWYKPTRLTAVSSHRLTTLPAKISAFNSYMYQNAYYCDLKCIFEDLLPCYCCTAKAKKFSLEFRNLPL